MDKAILNAKRICQRYKFQSISLPQCFDGCIYINKILCSYVSLYESIHADMYFLLHNLTTSIIHLAGHLTVVQIRRYQALGRTIKPG
jgi:hypothetical protein